MKIAVCANGDWADYDVTPEALERLQSEKIIWPDGTNTGDQYNEKEPRPIYSAEELPGESDGVSWLPMDNL